MCWPTPICGATASSTSCVPPEIPVPALAEVQVALQEAAAQVTGEKGEALKRRLRTGTVVTYDDRNWELRWTQERRRINLPAPSPSTWRAARSPRRAIACACPTARCSASPTSRCTARSSCRARPTRFYERAVGEHLQIGLEAIDLLRGELHSLHSRKLRSFDEPPFR